MLNRYHGYYYRLRSLSTAEVVFRLRQYLQKRSDKQQVGWQPTVSLSSWPGSLFSVQLDPTLTAVFPLRHKIFELVLDCNDPIDWHLDISTQKRFPLIFSRDRRLQSPDMGSAQYVWEVNRFPFLPALALRYRQSADPGDLARITALITSWSTANPYLLGINWHNNREVNVRLLNWFIGWNLLDASRIAKTDPVFQNFLESVWLPVIYQHCIYSRTSLSSQTLPNYQLIAGYAGLFVASSFWPFPESASWAEFAKAGLEQEIQRQYSPNGINWEESADYTQFITDFLLIAYLTGLQTGNPFSDVYTSQLENILTYIAHFLDHQGNAPQYGDEGSGRLWNVDPPTSSNNFRSLLTSAAILFGNPLFKQRSHGFDLKNQFLFGDDGFQTFNAISTRDTKLTSQFYPDEGHYILRKQEANQNEIYIHFNAAPLGCPRCATHGHADALSFSMNIDGQPFFVDSGTYSLQNDSNWRRYFISTRAHNTVCIDQQNQAFLDKNLRWLSHYTVSVQKAALNDNTDEVIASHNGYERIGCIHQRQMEFDKLNNRLLIGDQIENQKSGHHRVEVLFHIHPSIRFRSKGRNHFVLSHPQTKRLVVLQLDPALQVEIVNGERHPALLGWYSAASYQKAATCVFRAYRPLGSNEKVEMQHQITVLS